MARMNPLDKRYLSLQFENKLFSLNGTAFQTFFEDVMEKAIPGFRRIRPYGSEGDGGNDGYINDSGTYYQVHAPLTPKVNESGAAKKMYDDFYKLMGEWEEIKSIKEYLYVFNDKFNGSTQQLETTLSNLRKENPVIKFDLFLSNEFEDAFFLLDAADFLSLGFDVNQSKAYKLAQSSLELAESELDHESELSAQRILANIEELINEFGDDELALQYEVLNCRCLQKQEEISQAKGKYESLIKRFPEDSRPYLYLAEIFLKEKNYEKNEELLNKAEEIDSNNWLLFLEKLSRKFHLHEPIDIEELNEYDLPSEGKIRADFFRLYGLAFEINGDKVNADKYIENSIHLNPNKFINQIGKLSLIKSRVISNLELQQQDTLAKDLLEETDRIEEVFFQYGPCRPRIKARLNSFKFTSFIANEEVGEAINISSESFILLLQCYFDKGVEELLIELLNFISLPDSEFSNLLSYLKNSEMKISDIFAEILISQFDTKASLLSQGKTFFKNTNNESFFDFIKNIENDNYENAMEFILTHKRLLFSLTNTLKSYPALRNLLLENTPDDKDNIWIRLQLALATEEDNLDEAFQIVKQLDLNQLNSIECRQILKVVQQQEAWDFEIIILNKIIEREQKEKELFNLKLQLFAALQNGQKSKEAIILGKELLDEDKKKNYLTSDNREALLSNTLYACLERGKVDKSAYTEAEDLLNEFRLPESSFEFTVGIEAQVLLNNNKFDKAFASVIEAVKNNRALTPEEYAKLYFFLVLQIGEQIDFNLDSNEIIKENSFIKLARWDHWYFIGDEEYLDALPIRKSNINYSSFLNKKLGEEVTLIQSFSSEKSNEVIELIFPIEKYIFWQSKKNFNELSQRGILEGVQMVEVPQKGDGIDTQYLTQFFEDQEKRIKPVFTLYCEHKIPLAYLAYGEGGLLNAIGHILRENKGFINFSTGTREEFRHQMDVAHRIIQDGGKFYIDGTSALFLSESGVLRKISKYINNIKTPQSVINFLAETAEKSQYVHGQKGYLSFAKGNLIFSSIESDTQERIHSNFIESIKFLESIPENIVVISPANKLDCSSERDIPGELCDACILAQNEKLPVMTEDFLYLAVNEQDTAKPAPEYFSSLALVKSLYEIGHISFTHYLEYFSYLSSYRFRFLSISPEDIEKAVFGEGDDKFIKPNNLLLLNLPLILSDEYGVPFEISINVIGRFLTKVILDNSLISDITEQIFLKTLDVFPTSRSKETLSLTLVSLCYQTIKHNTLENIMPDKESSRQAIEKLLNLIELTPP